MRHPSLVAASRLALAAAMAWGATAGAAAAQDAPDRGVSYTYYGTPGLLEMPTAISADDGEIAGTVGSFGGQLRIGFTVQVTPRFSGTFRYSGIADYRDEGERYFDRSFDLRYRFTDEGPVMPMIAVGLQDFLGTGIYSGEYLVATKTVGDSVRVTGGLGWGRFATSGGFDNPLGLLSDRFDTRPDTFDEGQDTGGVPGLDAFFRGPAAVFGGIEYAPTPRFTLKAEYSSDDAYTTLDGEPLLDRRWPVNLGLVWRPLPGIQLQGAYMYGSELALGATFTVNPNDRPFDAGLDTPPQPVAVRARGVAAAEAWAQGAPAAGAAAGAAPAGAPLRDRLALALRTEGVELVALQVSGTEARVRYRNTRFRAEAQAMGRVARILTQELPPEVETLTLEPVQSGLALAGVTMARSDLEAYETAVGGSAAMLARASFEAAGPAAGLDPVPPVNAPFAWGLRPYVGLSLFGGDNPAKLSFGAELSASYRLAPGLVASGALRQQLLGDTDEASEEPEPIDGYPVVRRSVGLYGSDTHPVINDLTLAQYGRLAPDVYGRLTVGLLEKMYGGASAEVLWAPVRSRLALGLEVDAVRQRDFDQLFGFNDFQTVSGHASAYYDVGNGFHLQVDAGRYLAGDWGATFALDREWENGWRVGGYFSLTDMPFESFGEGSFDKGIRLTIPIDFVLGTPTRREVSASLASLTRDGGARVDVDGRLYEIVRDGHYADLEDSWGRFWR